MYSTLSWMVDRKAVTYCWSKRITAGLPYFEVELCTCGGFPLASGSCGSAVRLTFRYSWRIMFKIEMMDSSRAVAS
jgi:hypothetical protein